MQANAGGSDSSDTLIGRDSQVAAGNSESPESFERNLSDDFNELAFASLAKGNEYRAFQEKYAALILGDPAALRHQFGYSQSLARPVFALRWGVGIDASLPPNLRSDPNPVRDENRVERWRANLPGEAGVDYYGGEIGLRLLAMLRTKQDDGDFGTFASLGPAQDDRQTRYTGPSRTRDVPTEHHYAGIQILGIGNRKVLTHVGRRFSVDVVVLFDIDVRSTRQNQVHTTTTLQIIDAETGRQIHESPSLNNIRVELDRADRLKDDPLVDFFNSIDDAIEQELKLVSLPEITPEDAARRIESMHRATHQNPLPALAEIHLYYGLGLISQFELRQACVAVTELDDAAVLVDGTDREKRSFLEQWVRDEPES